MLLSADMNILLPLILFTWLVQH